MDPNLIAPDNEHGLSDEALETARGIAIAAAHRFRPSYLTHDFQPHFWVVAAIAQVITEAARIAAPGGFAEALRELGEMDSRINAHVAGNVMPRPITPESFTLWYEGVQTTRQLLDQRGKKLQAARDLSASEPPYHIAHMHCEVDSISAGIITAFANAGYHGGPLTQEKLNHLIETTDFDSIIRIQQARDEVPAEVKVIAETVQRELSEALGTEVHVHAINMGAGNTAFSGVIPDVVPPVGGKDEKEGSGNGSVH